MENTLAYGDRTYSFGMIPPEQAIEVEVAIARVVGEPLFKAFVSGDLNTEDADKFGAAGAAAIGLMMSRMDAADITRTMKTVFSYCGLGGQKTKLALADFHGRNKEMWIIFLHAVRYNFADFLPDGLITSLGKAIPK